MPSLKALKPPSTQAHSQRVTQSLSLRWLWSACWLLGSWFFHCWMLVPFCGVLAANVPE
uniref:Uncharacterized protein n=1 Tax=Anguilla anguilla TaxID=7936 RepID=A0A0E9TZ95_ANGAN